MTNPSERELAAALDDLPGDASGTAVETFIDDQLAESGWDFVDDPGSDDSNDLVHLLDNDGFSFHVERGQLPAGIDIETLPVTTD